MFVAWRKSKCPVSHVHVMTLPNAQFKSREHHLGYITQRTTQRTMMRAAHISHHLISLPPTTLTPFPHQHPSNHPTTSQIAQALTNKSPTTSPHLIQNTTFTPRLQVQLRCINLPCYSVILSTIHQRGMSSDVLRLRSMYVCMPTLPGAILNAKQPNNPNKPNSHQRRNHQMYMISSEHTSNKPPPPQASQAELHVCRMSRGNRE